MQTVFELDDEMWTIACQKNVIDMDYKNNYIGTNVNDIKIMVRVRFCEAPRENGNVETNIPCSGVLT